MPDALFKTEVLHVADEWIMGLGVGSGSGVGVGVTGAGGSSGCGQP